MNSDTRKAIWYWIRVGFLIRFAVMLMIHFTGAERSLSLTKDAFLYDNVGYAISEYLRTGDIGYWPARVSGVIDFAWEYVVGFVYYLVGRQPLVIKMICVLIGSLTPLLHHRIAYLATNNARVAQCALILSVLFPTQIYYSALMVRDSLATFAISLVFLGLTEWITKGSPTWAAKMAVGFLIMLGLRSYVTVVLAATIPCGLFIAALVTSDNHTSKSRAVAGFLLLSLALIGVVAAAPQLMSEVDTQFTDLNYINKIRGKMNKGSGAFFQSGSVTEVGNSVVGTITSVGVGVYFFFFSINPATIGSIRQIMAMPEVILVAFGTLYSIKGIRILWKQRRDVLVTLMVPTMVLTLGYSVATTNGGPLMRWRMQLIGVYLIFAATGLVASRVRRSQAKQNAPALAAQPNAEAV
ncbi:MAG: hypothetical protein MI861_22685 [Pirellulales bacterium]|nr:hypothetical protein [Pirellulales bacterium]